MRGCPARLSSEALRVTLPEREFEGPARFASRESMTPSARGWSQGKVFAQDFTSARRAVMSMAVTGGRALKELGLEGTATTSWTLKGPLERPVLALEVRSPKVTVPERACLVGMKIQMCIRDSPKGLPSKGSSSWRESP